MATPKNIGKVVNGFDKAVASNEVEVRRGIGSNDGNHIYRERNEGISVRNEGIRLPVTVVFNVLPEF